MIVIILYWIFLFFICSVLGNAAISKMGMSRPHVAVVPVVGIFCITLLASIFALFGGLSVYFEMPLIIMILLVWLGTRDSYKHYLKQFQHTIKNLNIYLKAVFVLVFLLAAFKSAGPPFILDNETYYVATIKWLDHYGFVPGLANLHLFLAQHSGWHIAQSSLNLDFLYPGFNDLNGFCLVLATIYALDKLHHYVQSKQMSALIIGLFPVFYVLLFQFISSPSPDLPIYILTLLILGTFFEQLETADNSHVSLMFLLTVFATFIKLTAVLLFVFPVAALLFSRKKDEVKWMWLIFSGLLTAILFGLKNYIISGYLLYPLSFSAVDGVDWMLPQELLTFIVDTTKAFSFYLTTEDYLSKSQLDLCITWLNMSGLHGYFNKYWLLVLALFPALLYFRKESKAFWVLYMASLLQFLMLWLTSPQYRFFLGFLILLSAVIMAWVVHKRMWMIRFSLLLSMSLVAVTTFFSLNVSGLTENEKHGTLDSFRLVQVLEPHQNSRYTEATYTVNELDGTSFFNPKGIDFFWAVGDCPLPCIQLDQYNYFRYHFKRVPAMRSEQLKDGFYSKKIQVANFDLDE